MNERELVNLINVYRNAVTNNDIDIIEKIVQILPEKIPLIDRREPNNHKLLAELKSVHTAALGKVKKELMILHAQINESGPNKVRDLAYKKTQLTQAL